MSSSNAGKPQWLQFFLISYLLILGYIWFTSPPPKDPASEPGFAGSGQTTGTLTAAIAAANAGTTTTQTVSGQDDLSIHTHPGDLVNLKTDFYDIDLDTIGGLVHSWRLMDTGSQSFNRDEHTSGVELVQRIPGLNSPFAEHQNWPLEISFKEQNVQSYEDFNHVRWDADALDTQGQAAVRLNSPAIRGIRVEKTLEMPQGEYYGKLRITIHNDNNSPVPIVDQFNRGLTLRWGPGLVDRDLSNSEGSARNYDAAVVRDTDDVQVFRPKAGGEAMEKSGPLLWAGLESKFFAALLVPEQPDNAAARNTYHFRTLVPNSYQVNAASASDPARRALLQNYSPPMVMELSTPQFDLAANSSQTFEFGVYVGPKKHNILKQYDQKLESLMFHESWWWMRALYLLMTDILNGIHRVLISNYGIAIMLLTVVVKVLVFPLVLRAIKIQAKSSADIKRIKPHLEAINEKYKEDPQEKQRQTWKVYQEHGVNPLSGMRSCLPILPQMPVFIALYRISNDTLDLQGASFLWIRDLSQADHLVNFGFHIPWVGSYFNLLPILVAFTQMVSSKISMSRAMQNITDPNQLQMQKMMVYVIPVVVMVTMYKFPAALMLYWMASNTIQIGQSMITNRILDREEAKHLKAGPPPRKAKKANPDGFMAKLMAKAEEAKKEMERREELAKKAGATKPKRKK